MLKKLDRKYIIIIAAILFIAFVFIFPFRYAKDQEAFLNLLPSLITATSIIVAILIGYLFIRFVDIRQT